LYNEYLNVGANLFGRVMTVKTLVLAWTCLLLAVPCSADTISVDPNGTGDYPTIQIAIDAASGGDTVIVEEGIYTENISCVSQISIHFTGTTTINGQVTTGTGTAIIADADLTINSDSNITLGGPVTVGGMLGLYAYSEIVINATIEALEIEMTAGVSIYFNAPVNGTVSVDISVGSGITGADAITGGIVIIEITGDIPIIIPPIIVGPVLVAGTVYVDKDAPGNNDGTSWEDAFTELQSALDVAMPGNEIRVAEGTYFPTYNYGLGMDARDMHFRMRNHIAIYGAFAGYGTPDPNNRDVELYETILSGDIGVPDDPDDNCYHVFYHPGSLALDPNAVLDGVTITAGNASTPSLSLVPPYGGGMYNEHSSPAVTNCTFTNNKGGGMYNYYNSSPTVTDCTFTGNGDSNLMGPSEGGGMYNREGSNPLVTNCVFIENSAGGYGGGGMYNNSSSPTVIGCSFEGNSVFPMLALPIGGFTKAGGGGMYNHNNSRPIVTGCTFTGNWTSSFGCGGGMYNYESSPIVTDCIFTDNRALCGGGMFNGPISNPEVTNCTFSDNIAYSSSFPSDGVGGGIANFENSEPTVTNCTFADNSAEDGGGMANFNSSNPSITGCTFTGNWASTDLIIIIIGGNNDIDGNNGNGGGLYNSSSSPTLVNCTFSDNRAGNGGGMCNDSNSFPVITDCAFSENRASYVATRTIGSDIIQSVIMGAGAGIYNDSSGPIVQNCAFRGNVSLLKGGGISNSTSDPNVINCTFSGNQAKGYYFEAIDLPGGGQIPGPAPIPGYGGAIHNNDSTPVFTNCTFAANRAENGNALSCDYTDYQQSSEPSNVRLANCILWDGGEEIWNNDGSTITITYSDVQGGWPGEGNIDSDPFFVDPGYWDPNNTPTDPNDDFWVDGDYHLQSDSLCIDAGDNSVVEPSSTDLEGNPRIINGIVDMGAYEALLPIEADVHIMPRVINRNNRTKRVMAIIRLPEGVSRGDVADDPFVMNASDSDGIEATWQRVIGWGDMTRVVALFDKDELMDVVEGVGRVELTVIGKLESGQFIQGSDTVRIVQPRRRRGRLRRGR
jgi:parallel beta-helix repeat protein